MIRVCALAVRSFAVCVVLLALARIVGTAQSSPLVAVLDVGPCVQPCWHAIQPGSTTLPQAAQILRADGRFHVNTVDFYELCWTGIQDQAWDGCTTHMSNADPAKPIERMVLWPPDSVRFGDAIVL